MDYNTIRMKVMYTNIGVPRELMEKVEQIVSTSKLGYRTRSEFIIEAVREKVQQIAKIQEAGA